MRHGPCLRSIPVGPQCHIATVYEQQQQQPAPHSTSSAPLCICAIFRVVNNNIQMTSVGPYGYSDDDLDVAQINTVPSSSSSSGTGSSPRATGVIGSSDDLRLVDAIEKILDSFVTTTAFANAV